LDTKRVSWHPMKVFLAPEDQFQISSVGPDDDIFIVDYSGSVDFTLCLAAKAKSVIVLDHHLTAVSAFKAAGSGDGLPKNLHVELDLQRSGATIALDYFSRRLSEEASACRGDPPVEAIAGSVGVAGAEELPAGEGDEEGAASPEASEAAVGSAQEEATTRASKRRKKRRRRPRPVEEATSRRRPLRSRRRKLRQPMSAFHVEQMESRQRQRRA